MINTMNNYRINIDRGTTVEQMEISDEHSILWNNNYIELFPNECKGHIYAITGMIYDKFGLDWKGWSIQNG